MLIPGAVPVLLSSQFSIGSGQTVIPDVSTLTAPFSSPILIDRVIVGLYCDATFTNGSTLSRALRAKFTLDRFEVSKDFVGLVNYAASPNPIVADRALDTTQIVSVNRVDGVQGTYSPGVRSQYEWVVWNLPKPVLLLQGSTFKPSFYRPSGGAYSGSTIYGEVTFAGVRLPASYPIPQQIDVPFASSFITGTLAANAVLRSIEPALQNENQNRSVTVQRITLSGGDLSDPFNPTVYLTHSSGFEITDGYVPLYEIVDQNRRAWTLGGITLDPKERIVATVKDGGNGATNVEIAIIGSRKEQI